MDIKTLAAQIYFYISSLNSLQTLSSVVWCFKHRFWMLRLVKWFDFKMCILWLFQQETHKYEEVKSIMFPVSWDRDRKLSPRRLCSMNTSSSSSTFIFPNSSCGAGAAAVKQEGDKTWGKGHFCNSLERYDSQLSLRKLCWGWPGCWGGSTIWFIYSVCVWMEIQ